MKDPALIPTDNRHVIPRRAFLRHGALASAGAVATLAIDPAEALAAGIPRQRVEAWLAQAGSATPEARASYTPVALTNDEIAALQAAAGRLIPTDELGPGADQAGVHIYIDQALAGPDSATLPLYQAALAALNAAAGENGFAASPPDTQDELLTQLEANELADGPEGFFALLLEHTRQGMFGDPVYGGNANFAGWDLIGYPGIKLVWSAEEQEIGAEIEPAHVSVEEFGGTGHE